MPDTVLDLHALHDLTPRKQKLWMVLLFHTRDKETEARILQILPIFSGILNISIYPFSPELSFYFINHHKSLGVGA